MGAKEEFEANKAKVNEFKEELKALMDKYEFGKEDVDMRNGTGNYCGTDQYLVVNGEIWYSETISRIIDSVNTVKSRQVNGFFKEKTIFKYEFTSYFPSFYSKELVIFRRILNK